MIDLLSVVEHAKSVNALSKAVHCIYRWRQTFHLMVATKKLWSKTLAQNISWWAKKDWSWKSAQDVWFCPSYCSCAGSVLSTTTRAWVNPAAAVIFPDQCFSLSKIGPLPVNIPSKQFVPYFAHLQLFNEIVIFRSKTCCCNSTEHSYCWHPLHVYRYIASNNK